MSASFTWIVRITTLLLFPSLLIGQGDLAKWVWKTSPIELEETGMMPRKGMFVGHHNGVDILAGGIIKDSLGNNKIFDDIYLYDPELGKWKKSSITLPESQGEGISLSTKEGFWLLGGKTKQGKSNKLVLIQWNAESKKLEIKTFRSPVLLKEQQIIAANKEGLYLIPPLDQLTATSSFQKLSSDWMSSSFMVESVTELPNRLTAISTGTIQGNGLHNCLYLFSPRMMQGPQLILTYNLFLKNWTEQSTSEEAPYFHPLTTVISVGAAHNLLIGAGTEQNEVWSHYTITDGWHRIDSLSVKPFGQIVFYNQDNTIRLPAINHQGELTLLQGYIPSQQQTFGTLNYFILFLYSLVLVLMGVYFSRRQKSTEDYFKGGGRIPWWAAGISIFGTALSAISFMAIPAKTFATDWAYLFNNLGPLYVAPIIALFFVPFFIRLDLSTAYEYLEKRFNLATRLLGSLSFIIYQIGRIGIVLYLPAIALNVVTGLDILLCISLMGILSVIYTMMGGIEGVIWTDVLQVIILMGGGFLCLVILIVNTEGGMGAWWQAAVTDNKFNIFDTRIDWQHPTLIVVFLGGFFSNLVSYSTDQTFVQRYLTASDVGKAKKSVYTNALLMLPATLLFFSIGTALYVFYQQYPSELQTGLSATDAIFPYFILSQLPQGVSGLLIAGVFAAAMSTLSSSMNSVASAYSNDFHARFGWRGTPMGVARWSTLITGIIGTIFAMLMATSDIKSVWDEFLKIIGLITGGLGGIFVLGMVSKKANGPGALVGLLGSAVVQYWLGVTKPVHLLLFTATGFAAAVIIGYIASLILPGEVKLIDEEE